VEPKAGLDPRVSQPAPGPPSSSASPAGGPVRQYEAVSAPCDTARWAALEAALGGKVGKSREQARQGKTFASSQCNADLAYRGQAGLAIMMIDVFPGGGSAEPMFRGLRGVQPNTSAVDGVGQGAYWFDDPDLGPRVITYDGNLQLSAGWSPLTGEADIPTDTLVAALIEVCRQTLAQLQT
jgi:hypothetical protein